MEPQVRVVEDSIGLGKSSLDKPSKGLSAPTFSPEKDRRAQCAHIVR